MELESDENFWLERELIEREAFLDEDPLPAVREMAAFFESAAPTMFINIRGKNYLLRREALV